MFAVIHKREEFWRTSHGLARAIVKGTSLRSPSPIMAPVKI